MKCIICNHLFMQHDTYGCKDCHCKMSSQELMGEPKPMRVFSFFSKEKAIYKNPEPESSVPPNYSSIRSLSYILIIFTVLEIGSIIYSMTLDSGRSFIPTMIQTGNFINLHDMQNSFDIEGMILILGIVVSQVFIFFYWIFKAYVNLPSLGVRGLRFRPKQAITLCILPVVNIWMKYAVMMEIWKASHPNISDDNYSWRTIPRSKLVFWWWITHTVPLAYLVFTQFSPLIENIAHTVFTLIGVVSSILLIIIVKRINTWQEENNQRMNK